MMAKDFQSPVIKLQRQDSPAVDSPADPTTIIAQLEAELADFQASSRELESELERELEEADDRYQKVVREKQDLSEQAASWKAKHSELIRENAKTTTRLHGEIDSLRKNCKQLQENLRDLELSHDDMEQRERITQSSYSILSSQYESALETIGLLESDLESRQGLQDALQHTNDELRDIKHEMKIISEKNIAFEHENSELRRKLEEKAPISPGELILSPNRRSRQQSSNKENVYVSMQEQPKLADRIVESPDSLKKLQNNPRASIRQSKSMRQIHGMRGQAKLIQRQLATLRRDGRVVSARRRSPPMSPSDIKQKRIASTGTHRLMLQARSPQVLLKSSQVLKDTLRQHQDDISQDVAQPTLQPIKAKSAKRRESERHIRKISDLAAQLHQPPEDKTFPRSPRRISLANPASTTCHKDLESEAALTATGEVDEENVDPERQHPKQHSIGETNEKNSSSDNGCQVSKLPGARRRSHRISESFLPRSHALPSLSTRLTKHSNGQ